MSPVAVGPSPMECQRSVGTPPTITVQDVPAGCCATAAFKRRLRKPANQTYVIASGDTLGKIASKYYGSSKQPDVQRIVAANKPILKDATTTLVVGKKLVIPNAPVATPAAAKTAAPVTVDPPATVYLPGPLEAASDEKPGSPLIEAPEGGGEERCDLGQDLCGAGGRYPGKDRTEICVFEYDGVCHKADGDKWDQGCPIAAGRGKIEAAGVKS